MDDRTDALLTSLLDRLDADALSQRPQFRGVVSDAERDALRALLQESRKPSTAPPSKGKVTTPTAEGRSAIEAGRAHIDTTVLGLDRSPQPDWILCLDFGTAKSKAFACTNDNELIDSLYDLNDLDFGDLNPLELPLGQLDDDLDKSVYSMSSSVWIDDNGLMFAGSEAVKRSRQGIHPRQAIESFKQEISQIDPDHDFEDRLLDSTLNPISAVPITYQDAITFYLSYLTDLAVTALENEQRVGTRYACRRFSLPWWSERQRVWASALLARILVQSQIVADTFRGRWREGIRVAEVKEVLAETTGYDEQLAWLLDERGTTRNSNDGSLLEALAAASSRVWTKSDRLNRALTLVVDVGAGTTDLSLFWTTQTQEAKRAFPVYPCGAAVKQGGDTLDSLLLEELRKRGGLGADPALLRRVVDDLRRTGVRRMKEILFETGRLVQPLANQTTVEITREEFLELDIVQGFSRTIRQAIKNLLAKVDGSWGKAVKDITLILTGGGCDLPMIRDLVDERWTVGDATLGSRLAPSVPDFVAREMSAEFQREYPQLAVAMGGAMPLLLDERKPLVKWDGDAPSPGPLTSFATRGPV